MTAEEVTLDVLELEPPEPYELATDTLRRLDKGQYVRMISRRRPRLLYPWLSEHGFQETTRELGEDHYEIFIWIEGDDQVEETLASTL